MSGNKIGECYGCGKTCRVVESPAGSGSYIPADEHTLNEWGQGTYGGPRHLFCPHLDTPAQNIRDSPTAASAAETW